MCNINIKVQSLPLMKRITKSSSYNQSQALRKENLRGRNRKKKKRKGKQKMAVGILEVHIVDAKGLGNTDFLGGMDPYVVVQYKSQERKSSVARGQGSSPAWNEKLRFRVEYPGNGGDYKLVLKIMDKDTFSADDFVGQAVIYVKDLLALGVENGTADIHPCKYSVTLLDQSYCGEIQVGVSFALKVQEHHEEDFGGWKQSDY